MPISEFRVRWKGRESGPYPLAELKRRLARGELSTLHRVEYQGRWLPVDRLIAILEEGPESPQIGRKNTYADATTTPLKTAYFCCGMSFLIPVVGTLAAVVTTHRLGSHKNRVELASLTGLMTLAGLLFWFAALRSLKLV